MSKIKPLKPKQGSRITVFESTNYDDNPPIFSLEKIQDTKYCFSQLNDEHKARFADAIFRRKNIAWKNIKNADRHGLGIEKISKKSIKAPMPKFITEDFQDFLALRYHGKNPMVGYRQRDVFYVLWFDYDFTLYKH